VTVTHWPLSAMLSKVQQHKGQRRAFRITDNAAQHGNVRSREVCLRHHAASKQIRIRVWLVLSEVP
jgi:hypothetical protein